MTTFWRRIFRSAFSGFKRNGWLSLVAVFIMSQALLIISIFASINLVIGASINAINERIDVAVFFKETVKEEQALALRTKVMTWEGVNEVVYVSPQEALDKFLNENRNRSAIRDVIPAEENFLPASLEVKVADPYVIEQVIDRILKSEDAALISETSLQDNQQLIARLRDVGSFIQRTSLILAGVFVVIALLIIFNTIRITIFTRRDEIEIMKLVGATDWYIRWPFIVEGMLYGVIATLLTLLLLYLGYLAFVRPMVESYVISTVNSPIFSWGFLIFLAIMQLVIGLGVGGFSSYLATKKHLNV
ncbi:MAG: permease-like cell division protein FtsX [Patescibacteria group bacterium]|nr:permease-like cell division protein FtsX [Patescibacteria group bacterium]